MGRKVDGAWALPLVAFSFIIVAATGILLLFHWGGHAVLNIHQWLGAAFLVAAMVHVGGRWGALTGGIGRAGGAAVLVAALLFAGAFLAGWLGDHPGRGGWGSAGRHERAFDHVRGWRH